MKCQSAELFRAMNLKPAVLIENGVEVKPCECRCRCESVRGSGRRVQYNHVSYWVCACCELEYDAATNRTLKGCCPVCGDELDLESGRKVTTCDKIDQEHRRYRMEQVERRETKRLAKWSKNVRARATA